MRDRAVVLACVLVVATNLGALGRGGLNRSSVESAVTLTERELRPVRTAASIPQLAIQWRQPSPVAFDVGQLDRAGFDTSVDPASAGAEVHYRRQLHRDVYVALEYDGPAWIRFRDSVILHDSAPPALLDPAQVAQQRAARAETVEGHTRLFAVGIDADARRLRAAFPERAQYLIARARAFVSIHTERDGRRLLAGSIRQLMPSVVYVPRPFSATLRDLTQANTDGPSRTPPPRVPTRITAGWPALRFSAELKYGRFHTPWISDLRPLRR